MQGLAERRKPGNRKMIEKKNNKYSVKKKDS